MGQKKAEFLKTLLNNSEEPCSSNTISNIRKSNTESIDQALRIPEVQIYDELESDRFSGLQDRLRKEIVIMIDQYLETANHHRFATTEIKKSLKKITADLQIFIVDIPEVNACVCKGINKIFIFSGLIDKHFEDASSMNLETLLFYTSHELGHLIFSLLDNSNNTALDLRHAEEHFCDGFSLAFLNESRVNLSCIEFETLKTKTDPINYSIFKSTHPSDSDRARYIRSLISTDFRSVDDSSDSVSVFLRSDFEPVKSDSDSEYSSIMQDVSCDLITRLRVKPDHLIESSHVEEFLREHSYLSLRGLMNTLPNKSAINFTVLNTLKNVYQELERFQSDVLNDKYGFFGSPKLNFDSFLKVFFVLFLEHGTQLYNVPFIVDLDGFNDEYLIYYYTHFNFILSSDRGFDREKSNALVKHINTMPLRDLYALSTQDSNLTHFTPNIVESFVFSDLDANEYIMFFHRIILLPSIDYSSICQSFSTLPTNVQDELFLFLLDSNCVAFLGFFYETLLESYERLRQNSKIDYHKLYDFLCRVQRLPIIDNPLWFDEFCAEIDYNEFLQIGYTKDDSLLKTIIETQESPDGDKFSFSKFPSFFDYFDECEENEEEEEEEITVDMLYELDSCTEIVDAILNSSLELDDYIEFLESDKFKRFIDPVKNLFENPKTLELNIVELVYYLDGLEGCFDSFKSLMSLFNSKFLEVDDIYIEQYSVLSLLKKIYQHCYTISNRELSTDKKVEAFNLYMQQPCILFYDYFKNDLSFVSELFNLSETDKIKFDALLLQILEYPMDQIRIMSAFNFWGFESDYKQLAYSFDYTDIPAQLRSFIEKSMNDLDSIFSNNINIHNLNSLVKIFQFLQLKLSDSYLPHRVLLPAQILAVYIERMICEMIRRGDLHILLAEFEFCLSADDLFIQDSMYGLSFFNLNQISNPSLLLKPKVSNSYIPLSFAGELVGCDVFNATHLIQYFASIVKVQDMIENNQASDVEFVLSTDLPYWVKEIVIYKHADLKSKRTIEILKENESELRSKQLNAVIKTFDYNHRELVDTDHDFELELDLILETFKVPSKLRDLELLNLVKKYDLDFKLVQDKLLPLYSKESTKYDYGESLMNGLIGVYIESVSSKVKMRLFKSLFSAPSSYDNITVDFTKKHWFYGQGVSIDHMGIHVNNLAQSEDFLEWFISKLVYADDSLKSHDNTCEIVCDLLENFDMEDSFYYFLEPLLISIFIYVDNSRFRDMLLGVSRMILRGELTLEKLLLVVLENFGVSGVKLAQVLSSQKSFDPKYDSILEVLSTLKENVSALNLFEFIQIGRREIPDFENIQAVEMLNSGSIGSVWKLSCKDGDKILKLKNPRVGKFIIEEKQSFQNIIDQLKGSYDFGFDRLVDTVFDGISIESDFTQEVANLTAFSNLVSDLDLDLALPSVDNSLSNENVIVMSRVDGVSLASMDSVSKELRSRVLMLVFQIAMQSGMIHADLHAGNIFYDEKSNKVSFIDFGLVVNIEMDTKLKMMALFSDINTAVSTILAETGYSNKQLIDEFLLTLENKVSIGDKIIAFQQFLETNELVISSNFDEVLLALVKMAYLFD